MRLTPRNEANESLAVTHKLSGTTFNQFSYTRKPSSNLQTSAVTSGSIFSTNATYSYNPLNQLSSMNGGTYVHDNADNLTTEYLTGFVGMTSTFDDANQLATSCFAVTVCASYGYNSRGDRITKTPTSGSATNYGYDRQSRLRTVTGGYSYAYNGDGLRSSKTGPSGTQQFSYDTSSSIPMILGDTTNNYIFGPDGLAIEQIAGTTPLYVQHDQLASTRLLTNAAGAVSGTYEYQDFGYQLSHSGVSSPLGYAGQYTDSETTFQYLRSRYYDPTSGSFLTRDPMSSLRRQPYTYVGGNPGNFTDPTGLFGFSDITDTVSDGWDATGGKAVHYVKEKSVEAGEFVGKHSAGLSQVLGGAAFMAWAACPVTGVTCGLATGLSYASATLAAVHAGVACAEGVVTANCGLAVADFGLAALAISGPNFFSLRGAHFSQETLDLSEGLWNLGFGLGTGLASKWLNDEFSGAC